MDKVETVKLLEILNAAMKKLADKYCVCRILATYADESVLNEKDRIDYHVFKPVLFEFPTYEYFVTGDRLGDCGKMNP